MKHLKCFLFITLITLNEGHRFTFRSCPSPPEIPEFDLPQFLGKWYIIETVNSINSCMTLTIEEGDEPSTLKIRQAREIFGLKELDVKHSTSYEGVITLNRNESSAMSVRWPFNVLGSAAMNVIETDYTDYALVFECQRVLMFSRQSSSILSRTSILDFNTIDRLKARLNELGMYNKLGGVNQDGCTKEDEEEFEINIDENTLKHPFGRFTLNESEIAEGEKGLLNINEVNDLRRAREIWQ